MNALPRLIYILHSSQLSSLSERESFCETRVVCWVAVGTFGWDNDGMGREHLSSSVGNM